MVKYTWIPTNRTVLIFIFGLRFDSILVHFSTSRRLTRQLADANLKDDILVFLYIDGTIQQWYFRKPCGKNPHQHKGKCIKNINEPICNFDGFEDPYCNQTGFMRK